MKKKDWKRLGALVLSLAIVLCQNNIAFAEDGEETGYKVSFVTDEHSAVDVYYQKDYSTPDEVDVEHAFARSSDTGEIDITGDGQVNFKVKVDEDYEVAEIVASPTDNYKNLKGSEDTGVENVYRMTKIKGDVEIVIYTKIKADNEGGEALGVSSDVVINEIESNGDATDWVEIYNKGEHAVDISGWYLTDDDTTRLENGKTTPLPEGTILESGAYFVFEQNVNFNFGLGVPDEANLFDKDGNLVEKYSWSKHAEITYARVPDGTGNFVESGVSTKGAQNEAGELVKPTFPNAISWSGSGRVVTFDDGATMFKADSSGLDFYNGQLYCINNKNGTFWVMDVNRDGSMDYADGFTANGKNLAFLADAAYPETSNPDAEGITVDEQGNAYAAVERDNNQKNVNYNVILQFNPWEERATVTASREWNITAILPDVPANAGIEAVEWVSADDLEGKLADQNTGKTFEMKNYPNAVANGLFFVALEENGHIYALALNSDSSAQLVAEIDPGIGGAMALDYDTYEDILWVGADDGYGNVSAQIVLNGTSEPVITLVNPPAEMDVTRNNEGFAIAGPEYTVDGLRPVYHFMDGVDSGVLTISYLNCDYKEVEPEEHVHTEVVVEGKQPICTEDGLSEGVKCSECGEWIKEQTVLAAAGHVDENKDEICDVCKEVLEKHVNKKPAAAKTGDQNKWIFWSVLMILAMCEIVCAGKKNQE